MGSLPQLVGLVRHEGVRDYSSLLERHLINPGDHVFIPLIQGSQAVVRIYTLLKDGKLDSGIFGKENPKKILQGAYWYSNV